MWHITFYDLYVWKFVPFYPFYPLPITSHWQPPVCFLWVQFCFCFFVFVYFPILHISKIIQYFSFSPIYFTWYNAFKLYLCCCKLQDFFFLYLDNNLLYISIVFFSYPSIDGYLGCLAIGNGPAINMGVHISFEVCVLFSFFQVNTRGGVAGSWCFYF